MTYLIILFILVLLWRTRIRDLIKRVLILLSIPFLHVHFLKQSENPLVFQAWTLLGIVVILGIFLFRIYCIIRRKMS